MTRSLPAILILLVAIPRAVWAQDSIPRFTQFDFARERIGHKVIVDATLTNPGAQDLTDVRITVSYFLGDRELRKSKPTQVSKVAAGQFASFTIETINVPNFERYVLYLEIGARRLIYVGNEASPMPSPRSLPEKLVLESVSDARPKVFPADVPLKIAITNAGDLDAREPFAAVQFKDSAGAVVHSARVALADRVLARHRDLFEVTIPRVPAYAALVSTPSWIAAEFPSSATEEAAAGDLSIKECRIVRFTDGSVRITGSARNGLAQEVGHASATFRLGRGEHTVTLPAPLKPGDVRTFEFVTPDCPAFDDWSFSLAYGDAARPGSAPPPAPALVARRTESKETAEGLAAKSREKDPMDEGLTPNKFSGEPGVTAELRGLFWIEGMVLKNKQYTGDVAFVKVALRDAKGKPFQPVGVLSATVYVDGDRRTVTRQFRKESWKVDTAKVNAMTVTPDFIAHDAATGDLWVGLFRWDKMTEISRADLSVRIVDVGIWEWKGLDKACKSAAKPPDALKK